MSGTDIIERVVAAINGHDPAALEAVYITDAVVHDPVYPEPLNGRAAIQKDLSDYIRAFPDLRMSLRSALASGDRIASEFTLAGTHQGPLSSPEGDVPATGKSVEVEGAVFARTNAQGEIVEEHRYYDVASLMGQLGLA